MAPPSSYLEKRRVVDSHASHVCQNRLRVSRLREQFRAEIQKNGFRRAHLVPLGVRLALSLRRLRRPLLGLPALLSGSRRLHGLTYVGFVGPPSLRSSRPEQEVPGHIH